MSKQVGLFQVINSTGEVVGGGIKPFEVALHGFVFSNSAAAVGSVSFYKNADPTGGNDPSAPSAAGTLIFTVQILANSSKEFFVEQGIFFKYGIFAIASAVTVTGGVIWS